MKKLFSGMILAATMTLSCVANAGLIELEDEYLENNSSVTFAFTGDIFNSLNTFANFLNPLNMTYVDGDVFSHIFDGEFGNIGRLDPPSFNTTTGNHSLNIDQFYVAGLSYQGFINAALTSMYSITQFDDDFLRGDILEGSSFQFMSKTFDVTGSIFMANDHANGKSAGNITLNYLAAVDNGSGTVNVPEPSTLAIFGLGMIGLMSRKKFTVK